MRCPTLTATVKKISSLEYLSVPFNGQWLQRQAVLNNSGTNGAARLLDLLGNGHERVNLPTQPLSCFTKCNCTECDRQPHTETDYVNILRKPI